MTLLPSYLNQPTSGSGSGGGGSGGTTIVNRSLDSLFSAARTGTGTDYTGAPLNGEGALITLGSSPNIMIVSGSYDIVSVLDSSVVVEGTFKAFLSAGNSHVSAVFDDIAWTDFSNIGTSGDTVSVGFLPFNKELDPSWTLEYNATNNRITIVAHNASTLYSPVVTSLLIFGR